MSDENATEPTEQPEQQPSPEPIHHHPAGTVPTPPEAPEQETSGEPAEGLEQEPAPSQAPEDGNVVQEEGSDALLSDETKRRIEEAEAADEKSQ